MARKKDAEEDQASKAILDQLQTKTVGAPPSTTGLTGDQLPETIFNVDTFDLVRNQVTLQLTNLELLNVLNTIGQVTNTQSQSGPIPGTSLISGVTASDSNQIVTIFSGRQGQVWELMVADFRSNNASTRAQLRVYIGSDEVEIGDETGHGGTEPFDPKGNFGPIFIDGNSELKAELTSMAAGREVEIKAYLIRVR